MLLQKQLMFFIIEEKVGDIKFKFFFEKIYLKINTKINIFLLTSKYIILIQPSNTFLEKSSDNNFQI